MNGVLDYSLVGLVLLMSAGYAVSSLGPRSLRRRMLAVLRRMLAHAPFLMMRRLSQRLVLASAEKAHGACGGCDSCGSEQAPASPTQSPAAEVRVPVGKIGRRGKAGRLPNF